MLCFFGHDWLWTGSKSASGTPTIDLYRCEKCGATKEEARHDPALD